MNEKKNANLHQRMRRIENMVDKLHEHMLQKRLARQTLADRLARHPKGLPFRGLFSNLPPSRKYSQPFASPTLTTPIKLRKARNYGGLNFSKSNVKLNNSTKKQEKITREPSFKDWLQANPKKYPKSRVRARRPYYTEEHV
jgi:hypothetical protein